MPVKRANDTEGLSVSLEAFHDLRLAKLAVEFLFSRVAEGRMSKVVSDPRCLTGRDIKSARFSDNTCDTFIGLRTPDDVLGDFSGNQRHFVGMGCPAVQAGTRQLGGNNLSDPSKAPKEGRLVQAPAILLGFRPDVIRRSRTGFLGGTTITPGAFIWDN